MEDKRVAAAIAAVLQYIQTEEEVVQMLAAQPFTEFGKPAAARAACSPWGLNGRQAQMQNRNLMQMRAFRR
jgi:hypothetical protein